MHKLFQKFRSNFAISCILQNFVKKNRTCLFVLPWVLPTQSWWNSKENASFAYVVSLNKIEYHFLTVLSLEKIWLLVWWSLRHAGKRVVANRVEPLTFLDYYLGLRSLTCRYVISRWCVKCQRCWSWPALLTSRSIKRQFCVFPATFCNLQCMKRIVSVTCKLRGNFVWFPFGIFKFYKGLQSAET